MPGTSSESKVSALKKSLSKTRKMETVLKISKQANTGIDITNIMESYYLKNEQYLNYKMNFNNENKKYE